MIFIFRTTETDTTSPPQQRSRSDSESSINTEDLNSTCSELEGREVASETHTPCENKTRKAKNTEEPTNMR